MEELFIPSVLIYDSEFDINALRKNKPYRNIGQLLMSAKSVRDALHLCGAEERILDGSASDYECFAAICSSMELLVGHKVYNGVKRILSDIFNIYEQLSPFNCDELWEVLNSFIDDNGITPTSLLSLLGVESLSVRVSPFDNFDVCSEDIDLYSVTDLSDVISLVTADNNDENDCESFISRISSAITERAESGSFGVFLTLGNDYEFERMSRKHEVYEIYTTLRSGKTVPISAQNGLKTYVLASLFGTFKTLNCNIITDFPCSADELSKLLNYLRLNKNLPSSMLIYANDPDDVLPIALEFSNRNEYGLPSIIPVCPCLNKLARVFPIGLAIEYQNGVTDTVSVASLISSRGESYQAISLISDPDSLLLDLTYANIKNRMRI